MKRHLVLISAICITISCAAQTQQTQATLNTIEELKLLSTLWQQDAAEYRALCYQAYNTATLRLNEIPKRKFKKGKIAIITDLDETVLDNSYLEAQLMKENKSWNLQSWLQWTNLSAATAVPGAVEFFQYAKQRGASIFYVSNRIVGEVQTTLVNLKKLNLPDADTSHMLFLSNTSSKEPRRLTIMKDYNVVMLLGDNLNDFAQVFEGKNISDRFSATDKAKNDWGNKFIVLPNPTYGEWENALYNYKHDGITEQKLDELRSLLKGFTQLQ
jgi:5'-nucleotidase (lipoprotein e(P4) family)